MKSLIEAQVYSIIDRVLRGQPIEDDHVELKTTWPPADSDTARQIAAHANTSFGEPILWLIGINEKAHTVPGAPENELANWIPQVEKHFSEQLPPQLINAITIPYLTSENQTVTVFALRFETDRAPYVVKVPGGGSVTNEVPWRDGNRTRSAKRSDLLRLLLPTFRTPGFELQHAYASLRLQAAKTNQPPNYKLYVQISGYIIPRTNERVVFLVHNCELSTLILGTGQEFTNLVSFDERYSSPLHTIRPNVAIFDGPGHIELATSYLLDTTSFELDVARSAPLILKLRLHPVRADRPIALSLTIEPHIRNDSTTEWILSEQSGLATK